MPEPHGRDRVALLDNGQISLGSLRPKGWEGRNEPVGPVVRPGTAVQWDDALYEVLRVETSPAGGTRYLLALWALPDSIVEAVTFHHSPDHCLASDLAPMPAVHMADILEHQCRSGLKEESVRGFDERYAEKYSDDSIATWREICAHINEEELREDG